MKRHDGRLTNQLRPTHVEYGIFQHAHGSVLFQVGNTKVLCSVMLNKGVPLFLRGKDSGWLTAEYAMLPAATGTRTTREISAAKRNGRSVEISRLIGRSLRAIVDLSTFGERTIYIDCDVLNADGGTRTACITGSYLALKAAQEYWLRTDMIVAPIITDAVAAVAVGAINGEILLDIDYQEDSHVDADFNFVLTRSGKIIEIQGASEGIPITWQQTQQMYKLAQEGVEQLLNKHDIEHEVAQRSDGFTLASRLGKQLEQE